MRRPLPPGFALGLGLALAVLGPARAPARDEAPTPASVLAGKGLIRTGVSFVLGDTEDRDRRMFELDLERKPFSDEISRLKDRRRELRDDEEAARRDAEGPRKTGTDVADYRSARGALAAFDRDSAPRLLALESELQRVDRERGKLASETRKLYQALWDDPAVRSALREMNRTARPRVVLGPVSNQAEYRGRLQLAAVTYLTERGLIAQADPPCLLVPAEVRAARLALQARQLRAALFALEAKEGPGGGWTAADLARRRRELVDQLATAPPALKRRLTPQIELIDGQIRRLAPGPGGDGSAARARAQAQARLGAAREEYVAAVEALRAVADAAPGERRAIEADPEVAATLAELKQDLRSSLRIVPHPQFRQALTFLAEAEAGIQSERVPLNLGKDQGDEPTVNVTLNGSLDLAMVIDPESDLTRIPAAVAARLGIVTAGEAAGVRVSLPDGRTLSARPATLGTVRVGSFSAGDVACLVLPDDASRAPAALGAGFLNRFACRVQFADLVIRIARVNLAAASGAGRQDARAGDSPFTTRPPGR